MKKKLLSLLLAVAMILTMAMSTMASAKATTLTESRTITDTLTVKEGQTLTIPEGVVLTLVSGAVLKIDGDVDLQGKIKVKDGAKVTGNLYGMNKKLVGKASDVGTKNAPVIAIGEGTVVLTANKVLFRTGLYKMARNANFPDDVLWKTDHEVFLEYMDNIQVNVKIRGPKTGTEETKYNYAKLQFHKGASNSRVKAKSGKIYWWLRAKNNEKSSWMYFDYAALLQIKHIIPNIIDDPSYLKAAAMTEPRWQDCMEVNNTQGTEPEWTKKDGVLLSDIVYDSSRDENNSFDLYIPKTASKTGDNGVMLFIHGGGWSDGEKSDMAYLAKRFARKGFITATLDYRLFPTNVNYLLGKRADFTMDDLLADVDQSIAKMKSVLDKKGYQAKKLGLCGYSAGGHMALLYAYRDYAKSAIPVKCVFTMCGPVDMHPATYSGLEWPADLPGGKEGYIGQYTGMTEEEMKNPSAKQEAWLQHLSPAYQITPNSVPTLALYGSYDRTIGAGHKPLLVKTLRKNGVPYELYEAKKSDHPLELDHQVILNFMAAAERFGNTYLK
ncbi:MAG: alpha/beta hydrolase [Clostridia bacterium]|nr:alpha/beta hydrolase [Clostridia bacterium]MBQ6785823.1 alpha/beta hydrolase [Clostridia bacterium]